MIILLIKIIIVALGACAGALWPPPGVDLIGGLFVGGGLAAALVAIMTLLECGTPGKIFGAITGFVVGAWVAIIVNSLIYSGLAEAQAEEWIAVRYVVIVSLCSAGVLIGLRGGTWLTTRNIRDMLSGDERLRSCKILDTSVIIDGRVADICETGFLDGTLIVPQFVLGELQQIADSSHSVKRNRGRRGLEILQKIQKQANLQVIIDEKDYPDVAEVDLKLIELARAYGGKIVTNDFNLNKVAQLRGVQVLNINELANALKPVVLPGECMRVFVLKPGKEANQGIGYLDDGTMVVVDDAKHLIGQTIDLVVTSVLQTTAGKMIFGKTEEDGTVRSAPQVEYHHNSRGHQRR